MSILITGGTGYIGSHTALTLLENGKKVIIIDNLSNSSHNSIDGIKKITGLEPIFYEGDILDKKLLKKIFSENSINAVIHFAGLKSVADSVLLPLDYYENNISGTLFLLEEMKNAQVKNLIFSSSATVYGEPQMVPLIENCKTGGTTNPYGTSKFFLEQILSDLAAAYPDFRITILRYFNPVGAHPSGIIGEDPNGTPCNLMPYICQVAAGKYSHVSIFGSDYPTKDGTGVRDFIHVMDLAEGHVAALKYLNKGPNLKIYNLGTGRGYSVLELLKTFERMTSIPVPYVFTERRAGDIAECWSDPTKAQVELGWVATRKIDDMVKDAWNWQSKHLDSYKANDFK